MRSPCRRRRSAGDDPETNVSTTVAGLPASLMTWQRCPEYVLWATFVRGDVGYEVVWIDQYATDNPPQQTADRATFLSILATFRLPAAP